MVLFERDLSRFSVKDLKMMVGKWSREYRIPKYSSMNKADLVKAMLDYMYRDDKPSSLETNIQKEMRKRGFDDKSMAKQSGGGSKTPTHVLTEVYSPVKKNKPIINRPPGSKTILDKKIVKSRKTAAVRAEEAAAKKAVKK